MQDTPWVSTWISNLDGKILIFHSVDHKAGRPSNCLKIHPICIFSLLTGLVLFHPLAFLKETRALKHLASAPFAMECHLHKVNTVWQPALSNTLPLPASSWAVAVWPKNVFTRLRMCRETHCLDLKVRCSGKVWSSTVLEVKQFLLDRGLKTHSLLMPFLPQRKLSFPVYCELSDTCCWKALAWRSFFTCISPCDETIVNVPTLTGKGKPTFQHLFHYVFSGGEIQWPYVCLEISWKCGDIPWVWTRILELGGKIHIFLLVCLKAGWPHNCLKMHLIALFSVVTAPDLLHPLAFLKQLGSSQLLATGPFAVECHLNYVPQYGTQYSQTHSCSLLPHMQSWCGLGTCLQGSEYAERSSSLTLEVRSSGQAWRSHILEAKEFLLDRGLKTHSLLMP